MPTTNSCWSTSFTVSEGICNTKQRDSVIERRGIRRTGVVLESGGSPRRHPPRISVGTLNTRGSHGNLREILLKTRVPGQQRGAFVKRRSRTQTFHRNKFPGSPFFAHEAARAHRDAVAHSQMHSKHRKSKISNKIMKYSCTCCTLLTVDHEKGSSPSFCFKMAATSQRRPTARILKARISPLMGLPDIDWITHVFFKNCLMSSRFPRCDPEIRTSA